MPGYGWGGGRFPAREEWERQEGGRNRRYGRDFNGALYGGEDRYGWETRHGREIRYGGDFAGPRSRGPRDGHDRVGAPQHPSMNYDERLQAAVRQKLFEDTWLDARNIQVEAEDGVIYLSGRVSSHLESRYAWDDAWETQGVSGVVARLEVEEPTGDDTSNRHPPPK